MAINIFTASGNIGNDCECKYTPSGSAIGDFSLPVKQGYGDYEKTSWVTCKLIGKRAESLSQYLVKGTKVTVSGEFVLEQWEHNGVKHSKPVIIVRDIELSGKQQTNQQPARQQTHQPQRQPAQPQYNDVPDDFDSDIPF